MRKDVNIGIVGTGGDGVVALGGILLKLTADQGYYASRAQHTEAQIRGGGSAVKLSLSTEPIWLPRDELDILVCFDWEKFLIFKQELPIGKKTIVFYEENPLNKIILPNKSFKIPFSQKSREATGSEKSKNIVALGLLRKVLGLPEKKVRELIDKEFKHPAEGLLESNLAAFKLGESLFTAGGFPRLRLYRLRKVYPKIVLHSNEAVGRGAIRAGCRFASVYPITPGSEGMDYLARELPKLGGVFVQGEDEIASMGFAVGASLTGAKAIDITSGPGFDLKIEMLGLAVAAEIPLVLIDVQRGGPSTGIPGKTEQSDLSQAIYGGHGDAPRVVLAPYNLEGCYRLCVEAFNLAEYYQVPVILLSDQWLGQTLVATDEDFLKKEYQIIERKKPSEKKREDYRRYRLAEDFISPMANVGDEGFVYQTTGLCHNEEGKPVQSQEMSQLMHEKRRKKLLPLLRRKDLVKILGNQKAEIGIMTWGSSGQAVLGTVKSLGLEKKVKVCIPELIHPLPEKIIQGFLKSTKRLLVVEMNDSGQFYQHLLKCQLELPKKTNVYKRVGGRPFGLKELSKAILEAQR